jgi:flagellar biosynthetic protein FliQ
MPAPALLVHAAQQALLLAVAVSLPMLAVAAVVGLVTAFLQAVTQIHDAALAHLPRLVAVLAALAVLGPWMARQIGAFALQMFVTAR